MTKINLTPLFVAFALIVIVGLAVAGGLRAIVSSFSPVERAEAGRTEALTGETVRHTTELNLIEERLAHDLAANKLATAVSAETSWRNLYNWGGSALIVLLLILAGLKIGHETTGYLAWREVEHKKANNPAWTPAGPMLMSRSEGGREMLLCQLSGASAYTDDREGMLVLIKARMGVVPTYLETLAMAQRDIAIEQARHSNKKAMSTSALPHPTIDVSWQGL